MCSLRKMSHLITCLLFDRICVFKWWYFAALERLCDTHSAVWYTAGASVNHSHSLRVIKSIDDSIRGPGKVSSSGKKERRLLGRLKER